jgi:thiamine biosynthesis lipoprotein ApbE
MPPRFVPLRSALRSRTALAVGVVTFSLLGWCVAAPGPITATPQPEWHEFSFRYDHVIGTSLDLWVVAPTREDAEKAEQAVLDEIERLRLVFSTYDPNSEISRLNRATGAVVASGEMLEVLRDYETWQVRSKGALNGQLGALVQVWKEAERAGAEPDTAALQRITREINRPGWTIDDTRHRVTRRTSQPLNLNAIAKGYIIHKAATAARAKVSSLRGLLLNLGGDMLAWGQDISGQTGWTIGVQDPFRPEENATPLTRLRLRDLAVATSGAYERPYRVGARRYSHIFDPRTGRPAEGVASSTVVAPDNVTANALATTLCVLSPEDGLRLIAATPNAQCLLVTSDGRELPSAEWRALELPAPRAPLEFPVRAENTKQNWPDGRQVTFTITLPTPNDGKKYRRPYVAVWIENAEGKAVRSIAVWGNSRKYLRDLSDWWKFARDDDDVVKAVTRATRGPGKYTLNWDGKDDKGKPLPQGTYTIQVEVTREYGRHVSQTGKIECKADDTRVTLDKNAETEATVVEYTKKK